MTTELGGNAWGILIGDEPIDVVVDHNTFDLDGTTILYAYGGTASAPRAINGFRFTNNAAPHGAYGINGASASTGTLTLQMYFPGAVMTGNWLSGGNPSRYPAGNRFDTPFNPALTADAPSMRLLLDGIPRGLMTAAPQAPKSLKVVIISSGK